MQIEVGLGIGISNAYHKDVIELPDDATEADCNQACQDWANNYIDMYWNKV